MRVVALGMRALPGVAGGVESHCEHLYPLIASAGVEVEILVRSPYVEPAAEQRWRGVRIRRVWSPRKSGLEVIVQTFLGILFAAVRRPDIVHLHSVGPAIFTPFARMLGLHVVVTHHAPDYMQAKWGWLGKWILKTGERMAMRYANAVISVSRHGTDELKRAYGREPILIHNGVPAIFPPESSAVLEELGLEPGRYVLHVGRAIPDKRQNDLIDAFVRAGIPGWKLVLVGDFSGGDDYSSSVRAMAAECPDVVLAGFRSGAQLRAILTNAGCFALPSAIEGLPIAFLEALSAGCVVVCSDIPANHEIELPAECYFPVGDIEAIARAIATIPSKIPRQVWEGFRKRIHADYDWPRIAEQTVALYRDSLLGKLDSWSGPKIDKPASGSADERSGEELRSTSHGFRRSRTPLRRHAGAPDAERTDHVADATRQV